MNFLFGSVISLSVFALCGAQYYQEEPRSRYYQEVPRAPAPSHDDTHYYASAARTPPAQIISHKQALNHDGNFKYAFAAENGLAQGESIAPDGSRTGGYTYVDPTGKKISVKYTAGKDGFRILEGDHVPKAPPHAIHAEQTRRAPEPEQYHRAAAAAAAPHYVTQPRPQYQPRAAYTQPQPAYTPSNGLERERDFDYNDEPGKPHTFGSGYVFEFAG